MVRISGFGHQLSEGLVGGQVMDMRAAEDSIRAAVDAAERMANMEVRNVVIGISANQMTSDVRKLRCRSPVIRSMKSIWRPRCALPMKSFGWKTMRFYTPSPSDYGIDGNYRHKRSARHVW